MERFELLQTEEEREREKERYRKAGFEEWKIEMFMNEPKKYDKHFGLNHTFKKLSDNEEEKIDLLFEKREKLLEKYTDICAILKTASEKEDKLWKKIKKTNREICEIEGHRLEPRATEIIDEDGYGGYMSFGFYRECLVCGERIEEKDIRPEDVVVKGEIEHIERFEIGKAKVKKI